MWCRPVPSSVSPMYMPGRLRTASRPLRTWMLPSLYSAPLGASDVVIFDRSIARPRGRILGPFQVSPPATNLNSFNNLASFTRSVKQLITDSPPRCRRGREIAPGGLGGDEVPFGD